MHSELGHYSLQMLGELHKGPSICKLTMWGLIVGWVSMLADKKESFWADRSGLVSSSLGPDFLAPSSKGL